MKKYCEYCEGQFSTSHKTQRFCSRTCGVSLHGYWGTKLYTIWKGIRDRCRNQRNISYPYYGGKGITVCERWTYFKNFLEDMGRTYIEGLTIERKDNSQGYTPDNCCWASIIEQANNRSTNKFITAFGETHTEAQWARKVHITRSTLQNRFKNGWDPERALTQPVRYMERLSQKRFTPEQVRYIRQSPNSHLTLSHQLRVSKSTIAAIRAYRMYKNIQESPEVR